MKIYDSIYSCPVTCYHGAITEQDLSKLIISKRDSVFAKKIHDGLNYNSVPTLIKAFENLESQLVDEFGVSTKFEMLFFKQRDVNRYELEVLEGNRAAIYYLKNCKADLKRIQDGLKEEIGDTRRVFNKLHRAVDTNYQGRNSKSLTVYEFYADIADLSEQNTKQSSFFESGRDTG